MKHLAAEYFGRVIGHQNMLPGPTALVDNGLPVFFYAFVDWSPDEREDVLGCPDRRL
jgi:hypothetical protein